MEEKDLSGTLAPGSIVGGRFKIDRVIGRGGMGEVYAARHVTTSKEVALKIIYAAAGATKDQTRRFMREARAATAIAHPNVIEVFDVFEDAGGTAVMVMELLKGEPLSDLMKRRRALELHEVASILLPAMRALQAAHDKGVVHRDLKPDNIFLSVTGAGAVTKLLDFGIAKILDPARLGSDTQGQATNTGSLLGTPHYMSVEQAMSEKEIDARTDVWSMGVIVFEALTGRRPLEFENLGQMYKAFLQDQVPSIAAFVPDVPSDFAEALDRCLVKQPAGRAKSIEALASVLERYASPDALGARAGGKAVEAPAVSSELVVETKSPVSTSVARDAPPRSRAGWLVGGGVLVVAAAVAMVGFSRAGHAPSQGTAEPSATSAVVPAPSQPVALPAPLDTPLAAPARAGASAPKVKTSASASTTRAAASVTPTASSAAPPPPAASASTKRGIPENLPY